MLYKQTKKKKNPSTAKLESQLLSLLYDKELTKVVRKLISIGVFRSSGMRWDAVAVRELRRYRFD